MRSRHACTRGPYSTYACRRIKRFNIAWPQRRLRKSHGGDGGNTRELRGSAFIIAIRSTASTECQRMVRGTSARGQTKVTVLDATWPLPVMQETTCSLRSLTRINQRSAHPPVMAMQCSDGSDCRQCPPQASAMLQTRNGTVCTVSSG